MKVLVVFAILGLSLADPSQTPTFDKFWRIVNKKMAILQDTGCITVMECKLIPLNFFV